MPRSRALRALLAGSAGVLCAGSAVCATMAYTHPSHKTVRVATLAAVPEVGTAARAAEPSAGLLAWHAPGMPAPVALSPRVVQEVRVVQATRYVTARAASPARGGAATGTAASPRVTAARHVATPRDVTQAPTTQRTTRTTATTRTDRTTTHDGSRESSDTQRHEAENAPRQSSTTYGEPRQDDAPQRDDG